jgi:DNA-binding MarR family transcriptional regulator
LTERDHTANLLGALSLVVADRMTDSVAEAAGRSLTAATALSALCQFLDGPSVDLLRQVLGLTHSGTVRLVDRLAADGYLTREPGVDGRSVTISLTAKGKRVGERVSAARGEVLGGVLATLTEAERAALDGVVAKLLAGLKRGPGATRWICRLCDLQACGRAEGRCPFVPASSS